MGNDDDYVIWYTCYIDLFKQQGVGTAVVENKTDGKIWLGFIYKQRNTTINELSLLGLLTGLEYCDRKKAKKVHLNGTCKYVSEGMHRLNNWVKTDEIDLKAHSVIWKQIYKYLGDRFCCSAYSKSRREKEMLYPASLVAASHYRYIQDLCIQNVSPVPDSNGYGYTDDQFISKDTFLKNKWGKPLTDIQLEAALTKRRAEVASSGETSAQVLKLVKS